jgi:ribonuclease HI
MKRPTPPPRSAHLFTEPQSAAPAALHTAYIDGASRGNPGPASYAVIIEAPNGTRVLELGKYLGRETNNVAEYHALIAALDYATNNKIARLRVFSDSELLVRQMQRRYKVKSADLRPLFERASQLSRTLDYFAIDYIARERNRDADKLANQALDRTAKSDGTRQGSSALSVGTSPKTIRVRAHYVKGVLVPFEPLELDEGTEVTLDIRKPLN